MTATREDFDTAMLTRLRESRTEASRLVLKLHGGGRNMFDAVADAVEALPWRQTVQLRRWADNWQLWLKWLRVHDEGWRLDRTGSGGESSLKGNRIYLYVPQALWHLPHSELKKRSAEIEDAVAAGADVAGTVKFRDLLSANTVVAYHYARHA